MTYNIARILIVFEFLLVVYTVIKEKSKLIEINKLTASLILIFFLTQGFSIVFSFNVQTFLFVYKDLVFALLLFLVAIHVVNKNNINFFLKIFIIASSIYLLFQIITYLFPNITYSILQPLFYDRYWQFFDFQFNRNKYFGDAFDEVTVAFALFYLFRSKFSIKTIFLIFFLGAVIFITIASYWITKVIMLVFGMIAGIVLFRNKLKKWIGVLITFVIILLFASNIVSVYVTGKNVIDRITLSRISEEDNAKSVNRVEAWRQAGEMGISSPFSGIGLGNYYDYLPQRNKIFNRNSSSLLLGNFIVIDDPHNLFFSTFAASGFIGLFALIALCARFLISDIVYIRNGQLIVKSVIVAFWSLTLFSLLNPWMYFSYQTFYWLLRGFIEKFESKK